MIDFAKAWDALSVGEGVAISNGAAEPPDADSVEHRVWRSHNFAGQLADKIEGPPRQIRICVTNEAGNEIGFIVQEGDGHSFTPAILSPQLAYDLQWEKAKAVSDARATTFFELEGVGPVQTDEKSLTAIRLLVEEARDRIADGDDEWTAGFLNMDNVEVTVSAVEILAINKAVRTFFGLIYQVRQGHRAALNAALGGGATADEILGIDVTQGYPESVA